MRRVLMVSLYHPAIVPGGAQSVAKDLFDAALLDSECDPYLLSAVDVNNYNNADKVGAAITKLSAESDREFLLLTRSFDYFFHIGHDARRYIAFRKFLEEIRPDVIILHHSLLIGLDLIHFIRSFLPNSKIAYVLHEYLPICAMNGQLYRYHSKSVCTDWSALQCTKCFPAVDQDEFKVREEIFKGSFSKVDQFVAPSKFLKNVFVEWGLPPEKVAWIPNGHRSGSRGATGPSNALNRFGYFGQFIDAKGIDLFLSAAIECAGQTEKMVQVEVFGGNERFATPKLSDTIKALVGAAPPNLHIKMHGEYDRTEVMAKMSSVDWVVVPSVWPETFGLVVSEAWEARRPVIAANVGGLSERIVNGENGLTFTPGSEGELAKILLACIGNAALWGSLSDGIREEMSTTTTWDMFKQILR